MQRKETSTKILTEYLEKGLLPDNDNDDNEVVTESYQFVVLDGVLYFMDSCDGGKKKAVRRDCCVKVTVGWWLDTLQATNYSRCFVVIGGGLGCIKM